MSNNTLLDKLETLQFRFEEVATLITDPETIADQRRYVKLTKEYKDLEKIVEAKKEYEGCLNSIAEAKEILESEDDAEMREMAKEELDINNEALPQIEEKIKLLLVPGDPQDDKNAILEFVAEQEEMRQQYLQETSSACTQNIAKQKVGVLKYQA